MHSLLGIWPQIQAPPFSGLSPMSAPSALVGQALVGRHWWGSSCCEGWQGWQAWWARQAWSRAKRLGCILNNGHECSHISPGLSGTTGAELTQHERLNSSNDAFSQEGLEADFASRTGVLTRSQELSRNNTKAGHDDTSLEDVVHLPQRVADMNSEEDMLGVAPIFLADLAAGWQTKTGVKIYCPHQL